MRDLILLLNAKFTKEDKDNCVPTVHKIINMANIARTQGLLALELELEQTENVFFKTALELVIDGNALETVEQILCNLILSENHTGAELLKRLLFAEGILAMQRGENPNITMLRLSALLGEQYISDLKDTVYENKIIKCNRILSNLNDKKAFPESLEFENTLMRCHNATLQRIIFFVNYRTMVHALHGCSAELIRKIVLDNVSQNMCVRICEDLENLEHLSKDDVISAQKEIFEKMDELVALGEIIY
ncbi:MAG: hypothetical protein FWD44_06230 [Oscillospiraceae bacterium]|nr:hypothetical protein [Oscillospiraceae bacterium]